MLTRVKLMVASVAIVSGLTAAPAAATDTSTPAVEMPASHQRWHYFHIEVYGAGIPAWQGFAYTQCINRYWDKMRELRAAGYQTYTINKCDSFAGYYVVDIAYRRSWWQW